MLAITVLLLNRKRISAKELSERFEVSVRTIYRDIEAINMAGIPVISYPGNNGGFGIMDNYKFDRQVMTLNDMVAILSALKGVSGAIDSRNLDSAIEKITSVFPREASHASEGMAEQLIIDILPWGYRKRQRDVLQEIQKAIQQCRELTFLYRNARGESVTRTVEPMTLILKGFAWYLFAYCTLKDDYRIFRLSRISELEPPGREFVRKNASYKDYMKEDEAPPSMVDLLLRFMPPVRHRVEDYFDPEVIHEQEDGSLLVRVSFPEDEWVYSHLLSYGENLKVEEPLHVRIILQQKAKKIAALYQT